MKILLDKEFKEIKETIEMYKDKYNEALEDYYKCYKSNENYFNKYIEKLEENKCLQEKIGKTIKYIEELFILEDDNVTYEFKNNEIKLLLKILKG